MAFYNRILKRIIKSPATIFILRWSKKTSFPGFHGIPIFDVINFYIGQVKMLGIRDRAASIAFNFVMAIPAAIIFLFTLIPFLPISNDFEQSLYGLIRDIIPGEKNNAVLILFLHDFINHPRTGLLSLGFILSMFFSSNAIMGIMRTFDKNYIGFRKRTELQKRGAALKITVVMFLFLLAATLLLVAQGAVLKWLGIKSVMIRNIITNTRWIVIVFLFFAIISYIYRHAPAVHKKWKIINPGSILASVSMIVLTLGFSWWVNRFGQYNQLYGSIGTVLILMLLIYFNSMVLLIGFELNVSINSLKKIAEERQESEHINIPDKTVEYE